jgi:O-antigen ligase
MFPILLFAIKLPYIASIGFQIYGERKVNRNLGLVSNNFSWSALAVFLSTFTLITRTSTPLFRRGVLIFLMLFCVFVIMLSQSRTSLLILAACILFLMGGSNLKLTYKILIVLGIVMVVFLNFEFGWLDLGTSRFNEKLVNSRSGFEKEWRVIVLRETSSFFQGNQDFYLHGFGWGVFVEAYQQFISPTAEMDMHNTYLQLLFEVGIFPFAYFLIVFLIPTVYKFLMHYRNYLIFIPFIILPYFENNLNSGQFVFFPFMFTLFFISRHINKHA